MLKLYSPRRAERIIGSLDAPIRDICAPFGLPPACLQAILYQELTKIDLLDPLADLAVRMNHLRLRCAEALGLRKTKAVPNGRGPFCKIDSSTGYAQVFAGTGISCLRFAFDHGLADKDLSREFGDRPLDPENREDLFRVWLRLHRDRVFNLKIAALALLSAAEERVGSLSFPSFSAEQLKLVFSRYNGTVRGVSPYGELCLQHYLRYSGKTAETHD